MGLDILFSSGNQEILHLRNHSEFLSLFDQEIGGRVYDGYDDFHVTALTLQLACVRLSSHLLSEDLESSRLYRDIPEHFWDLDGREGDWRELLKCYPAVLNLLFRALRTHGDLRCSYDV